MGGEKNSTSVARLVKKSFKKNSASFKETKNKAVTSTHLLRMLIHIFDTLEKLSVSECLPDQY